VIKASIDIGTNTVLLLVSENIGGRLHTLSEEQRMPRLGRQVDSMRNLSEESMQRVVDVLVEYKNILIREFASVEWPPVVTATSAVRDAANREDFLSRVVDSTGWQICVLSGDEEAQTTFKGALSVLNPAAIQDKFCLILDIGGGSTEFALCRADTLLAAQSLDMGSVRFTERYFSMLPPSKEEMELAVSGVQKLLATLNRELISVENFLIAGVAGTVTSIAAIEAGLTVYEADKLNGVTLTLSAVQKYRRLFGSLTPSEIEEAYSPFLTGRGEVITAGLIILEEVMKFFNKHELIVSTGGIRHGMII